MKYLKTASLEKLQSAIAEAIANVIEKDDYFTGITCDISDIEFQELEGTMGIHINEQAVIKLKLYSKRDRKAAYLDEYKKRHENVNGEHQ